MGIRIWFEFRRIPSVSLVVTTLVCLTCIVHSTSASASASTVKRGINSSDSDLEFVMALVQAGAGKLDQSRFTGDPFVLQNVDRLNKKSYYKQGDDIIFERDSVDTGKPVIVLKAAEDGIKPKKKKRIFVVLKKNDAEDKSYWVTFAYIRHFFATDDPAELLTIDGEKLRIEWDTWKHRGNLYSAARAFGWTTCAESVFVACKTGFGVSGGNANSLSSSSDYDEVKSTQEIKLADKGGGVAKAQVDEPKWGLNKAAASSIVQSEFVASLTGKASYVEAKNDGSGMISGGDGEEEIDFFADLDDSPSEARMVGASVEILSSSGGGASGLAHAVNLTGADFFSQVGWKTQDIKQDELATKIKTIEDAAFIGYGTCPYMKQTVKDLDSANTAILAAEFYLTTLRSQCSMHHANQIKILFDAGILTLNKDNTLSVPVANPLLKQSKLTKAETEDLSRGYETSMFTQAFAAELRSSNRSSLDPEGRQISRAIFTLIRMALHSIKQAKIMLPAHFILVTRNLVQTLKSTNTKSLQDWERIKSCSSCPEKERNLAVGDIYSLQAIQQFIIAGLGSVVSKDEDPFTAYENYFKKHGGNVREKTKRYL